MTRNYSAEIARVAREKLGRDMIPYLNFPSARAKKVARARRKWQQQYIDWPAADAVKAAAQEVIGSHELLHWVPGNAYSMDELVAAYVARYCQAYGPLGNMIDIGAHIGADRPLIVHVT